MRFDGQPLRYLLPYKFEMGAQGSGHPATHLIFPCHMPDLAGKMESLSPIQALRAVSESGYQVVDLDEENVARILQWLGSLSCYSLIYSSTAEALRLLESIEMVTHDRL